MKLAISLLAVAVLASSALAAPITSVSVAERSGRLSSSWEAVMTLDSDPATFWYSELSNDVAAVPYVIYQFDAVYAVGDVAITMSDGNNRKLDIAAMSVSTDGVNYTPVGNFTVDIADGAVTTFSLGGAQAMYVRLDGVQAHYNNWNDAGLGLPLDKATPGAAPDGKYAISFADIAFSDVPEPATLGLLTLGGLVALRRRRA